MALSPSPPKSTILNKAPLLIPILFLFISISHCYQHPFEDKQSLLCAVLHSEPQLLGEQYKLFDFDQSVNLTEDYRASDTGWSATRSVNVASNCQLKVCNDTYLDEENGFCQVLNGGEYQVADLHVTNIASVECTCKKECKCSDVVMKRSSCARAYLKGGCKTCNSMYTELVRESSPYFPEEFYRKIEALRIRKGCKLTTYSEEDFEGEEIKYDETTVENNIAPFLSFECNCNDDEYEPKVKPPRPASFPALIEIPSTLDDILKMLAEKRYSNHPGLKAALGSNIAKRSSKNAYILLLGTAGAGKSSAMNILFANPNMTKPGYEPYSTTTDIREFRIPVPIDELGIGNSELRIIDTPGLGDTRGLDQDARFLATLDDFLSNHDELSERIPNVVLIFHKFHDNRINGERSLFVNMLRALESFRSRITDENYSNVIFVLSHFCSETKATRRRPDLRLLAFKEIIENYSLFPKPILISVAENKAREQDLPMVNGFFKLPNNEYYPKNLFEKLELVTGKGSDLIGQGVLRTAFRDSDDLNITSNRFPIVDRESSKVQKYLSSLLTCGLRERETEVSQLLQKAWDTKIDITWKLLFPHTLSRLQKALSLRNVNTKEDIPKTSKAVISLLTEIKADGATKILLEEGLGMKPPAFPHNTIAGFSYNVFKDTHLLTSPFSMRDLEQSSSIAFMLPKILTCTPEASRVEHLQIFENRQDYVRQRLESLGISGRQVDDQSFTGDLRPGYNIRGISLRNDSWDLSGILEIRLFQLRVDRLDLTPAFKNAARNLPALDQSDPENLLTWNDFFNEYGTHVVSSVFGGGSIEIQLRSTKPLNKTESESIFDLIRFAEDLRSPIVDNSTRSVLHETEGITHSLKFTGGDLQYHTNDLTKMSVGEAVELLANWKKSLQFYPSVLTTDVSLIPISQIVRRRVGRNYSVEIDRVASLKLNSSLTYVPAEGKQLCSEQGSQTQDPLMTALLKIQQEQSKRMEKLMLELEKAQQRNG